MILFKFSPNILLIILYQLTQVSSLSKAFILFEILQFAKLPCQISKFSKGNNSKKNHMNYF